MNQEELQKILSAALDALYEHGQQMIGVDVAERTLCGQLSAILQRSFPEHFVNVEYNRHGVDPKEIKLPDADGVLTGVRVFPDIIVHQLGHDKENILVVEVKKSTNPATDEGDLRKLKKIKEQLDYRFAVFLRLPTGSAADRANVQMTWIPQAAQD